MVAEMQDVIGIFESLYTDALIDASGNYQASGAEKNTADNYSGTRYMDREGEIKDASQLSEHDLSVLLEMVENRELSNGSYVPLRATTPQFLIDVVFAYSDGKVTIQNLPMAATVEHIIQNMEEEDGASYGEHRPHGLSKEDIITISKAMGHPSYIVLQKNGRYAEIVSFYNSRSKKVVVSIDFAEVGKNYKYRQYMNGNNAGYYNIIVTEYEPDSLKSYLNGCKIIYDKAKMNGKYQVGSGRVVTFTHDTPFNLNVAQENPAVNKKFSDQDAALKHFGRTYSWKETGYLLTDGSKLDFSGRHEGASGGYRTVDHRDILDIYPEDTELDGNGAMVDFMKQGNIRIMPEGNGINLQVRPTKAQERALDDFISKARGEVTLDIDDERGNTLVSMEYPKFTRASKVLQDIRNYFETGAEPTISLAAQFHYSDRDPEYQKVNSVLEQENAKLREDVTYLKELLKLQRSVTGGTKFTKTSVEAAAGQLMKAANAKGDRKALAGLLNSLYEYIAKEKELTWEGVSEAAQPAVDWLQKHVDLKPQRSEYAQEILGQLRGSRIYLDESQKAEAAHRYGSFNDFRKSLMGSITIANDARTSLDSLWQEMAALPRAASGG